MSFNDGKLLELFVLVNHQLVGHFLLVNVRTLLLASDFGLISIDELHWDAIDDWL